MPKNTTQGPLLGLEPGPLNPKTSALTMRPPRLPQKLSSSLLLAKSQRHIKEGDAMHPVDITS